MSEISRLRQRLSNVGPAVIEYRMSIKEAKLLLAEIDNLIKQKPPEPTLQPAEPAVIYRIIDSGGF